METVEDEEENIVEVSEVEHFKESLSSDHWQSSQQHDNENYEQGEASWVSITWESAKKLWRGGEEILRIGEVVLIEAGVLDDVDIEIDQVNDGVNEREDCEDDSTSFVIGNMKIQGDKFVDTKGPKNDKIVKDKKIYFFSYLRKVMRGLHIRRIRNVKVKLIP